MRRARAPLCDACGRPLEQLVDAVVALTFDARDVVTAAGVNHRMCVAAPTEAGARLEVITAETATAAATTARLRGLARVVSISRVIAKLARLAETARAA